MAERKPTNASIQALGRVAAVGLDFAYAVGGMAILGFIIDWAAGTSPMWLLVCALIGVLGGTYRFIKEARRLNLGANPGRATSGGHPPERSEPPEDPPERG